MSDAHVNPVSLPDYPTLQQLARSLWRNGSVRGVAILVGAGLSKNAERSGNDTPEPPLWWELLELLKQRLYPHNPTRAPSDALRIAEEYRTYFGQAGLDDFIRVNFPDRSWSPGPLHRDLLELPWTDVLTTNWDTLLERAAEEITEPPYTIVRTESDLTHARSPRIVKLHGTLGDKGPLVFAEEDYRTYPMKFAAFVNLARQVFIENELVLLGFSGDDPNFLQWAGWVRDQLGGSARRIYLAGNLDLEPATRKYLEAHNIAPIDLAPLTLHLERREQHSKAIGIFLKAMKSGKPPKANEWKRHERSDFPLHSVEPDEYRKLLHDHKRAAGLLENVIPLLSDDRQAYPGWHLCPAKHRWGAQPNTEENFLLRDATLALINEDIKINLIYELVWIKAVAFVPITGNLQTAAENLAIGHNPQLSSLQNSLLSASVLQHARWSSDNEKFEQLVSKFDNRSFFSSASANSVLFQRCLRARDRFDFDTLAETLLTFKSDDPVWRLRCAALYSDIGQESTALKLIKEALIDLEKRYRSDRNSLYIKSCLAWASFIHNASQAWSSRSEDLQAWEFQNLDVNPRSEMQYFDDRAASIAKEQREDEAEIRPDFEVGVYREGKKKRHQSASDATKLLYEFEAFVEHVGIPIRLNHVDICASIAIAVTEVAYTPSFVWYTTLLRNLHSHFDRAFEQYFGRIAVAQMPNRGCVITNLGCSKGYRILDYPPFDRSVF